MIKIGLCDKEFEHIKSPTCYCGFDAPTQFEWDRDRPYEREVVCFTERCYEEAMNAAYKDCIRVAWPLEPRSIHAYGYDKLAAGLKKHFNHMLTFDITEALRIGLPCHWWTPGGSYIWLKDWQVYPKTKDTQIIASKKDWTEGHRLRHKVVNALGSKVDVYGRAYKYYDYQLEPFRDHRFAIVIENAIIDDYWTDKLTDAFATGTVPVVWGGHFLSKYFDADGIITWNTIDDLQKIIPTLTPDRYQAMLPHVERNYAIARESYSIVEDCMWHHGLKEIYNNAVSG